MKKQYSSDFKIEAVKIIEPNGDSVNKMTKLGIKPTTMYSWV